METVIRHLPKLLYGLPAVAFVLAGLGKLNGVDAMHQSFGMMGLPTWFGYAIGLAELAGGIGLLLPRTRVAAAIGLIPIMLGAIYFHVAYAVPSAVPAVVLSGLLLATLWFHRPTRGASA